ncbi:hypothetical protein ACDH60_10340 [Pseudomonas ficuserectae]|uniref:DUF3077 domain-containing protein n=2 Tax=Pseudomonas amygdali pv. lachrymans TaxID=53707 RepID=A0AAD0PRN6_PSEAV|nr:hypothetical protein [Pseudomonas amygdali]ARA79603.1 hypothetical protein B5U27_05720 [Pseudomonas amygdali pv. lachrymans]AXH54869.1 hypothetical protein PLA107_005625 [Pseudomonas amygdali pv. lachrymans str. M301315]KKY57475.1 hypothetical protein AAY85_13245 [Pseudomonas amygdali pv. lachrymans]PWC99067.1 hypothetical protein CX658_28810 [Pseudomonas amygdali pv. lachrymans]QWA49170.1 hypothetical protein C4C37_21660 [Pseudomonas amygdali pv. lachrymans]
MKSENTTRTATAQVTLVTTSVEFGETQIANCGECLFQTVPSMQVEDALQKARTLSLGLSQICEDMRESINYGNLVHCDGMAVLGFVAEAIHALVCSTQDGITVPEQKEAGQ